MLSNMMIAKLAFLRFTRSTLSTLNQNRPFLIEEFFNPGIFDIEQLLDSYGNMKSYDTLSVS